MANGPLSELNQDKKLTKTGFNKITKLITTHSPVIKGLVTTGVLAGINQLVDSVSFDCPCLSDNETNTNDTSRRGSYGFLFIFGPAVVFLLVGIFFNRVFWENVTGCCPKTSGNENTRTCCSRKCTDCSCSCVIQALSYGVGAFFVWGIISLVDGDFLACALTICVSKDPMDDVCQCDTLKDSDDYMRFFRLSQRIGWSLACVIAFSVLLIYIIARATQTMNHFQEVVSNVCKQQLKEIVATAFAASIIKEKNPEEPGATTDPQASSAGPSTASTLPAKGDQPVDELEACVSDLRKNPAEMSKFWDDVKKKLSGSFDASKDYLLKNQSLSSGKRKYEEMKELPGTAGRAQYRRDRIGDNKV